MTNMNNRTGAQTSRNAFPRSLQLLAGAVGSHPGRTLPITAMVIMYIDTASNPGKIPATNSLPMSCCVISPYTARTIEGGNMAPRVPPAAMTPVANDCGYLNRRISGYATVENVAAVATDDPLIAANPAQAAMVAMP